MVRLAVARLWFCSNSFNPRRTRLAELQRHEWTAGAAALAHPRPPQSDIDGLAAFLAARPGWEVAMLRCAAAPPGGPLAAGALGAWLAEVEAALRGGRFDAVYVSLHGACQAEGDPGADVTVLRRLRMAARRLPIVASFDGRANISDEVPLLLDAASGASGPGDGAAAAVRALTLLEGLLAGRIRPVGAVARVPALVPPGQVQRAIEQIRRDEAGALPAPLLDASVFSGFPWSDMAWAGPSALVWADRDAGAAREAASRLALRLARGREADSGPASPATAAALTRAAMQGRILVLDPADDPDSGGIGDTPELLRAVLTAAADPSAFGVLADAAVLAVARQAGVGAMFEPSLGACFTPLFGLPVPVPVRVVRLLPEMAVLQAGPVAILVAGWPCPAEPALFAAAGIDLAGVRLLAVKGGGAAVASVFPAVLTVCCPGPSSPDFAGLPFCFVPPARRVASTNGAARRGRLPVRSGRTPLSLVARTNG